MLSVERGGSGCVMVIYRCLHVCRAIFLHMCSKYVEAHIKE